MSQRWLLSAMGALVAICLCLTGALLWELQLQRASMVEQQRLIAETFEKLAGLAESKANEAVQPGPPPTPSSIKVALTLGKPDGPPAVGYSVSLKRLGVDTKFGPAVSADSQGFVNFGSFLPARYGVSIVTKTSDWKADREFWKADREFDLPPSNALVLPIVCPSETEANVSLSIPIPEDLKQQGVCALLQWDRVIAQDQHDWTLYAEPEPRLQSILVCGEEGYEKGYDGLPDSLNFVQDSGSRWRQNAEIIGVRCKNLRLSLVIVTVWTGAGFENGPVTVLKVIAPRIAEEESAERSGRYPLEIEFVVTGDKPNQWTVPVPDELIEQARAYLKEHPAATSGEPTK